MFPNFFLTLLTAVSIAGKFTSAQICTDAVNEALAPCTCGGVNQLSIFCYEDTNLRAVFERVSPMVDENVVLDMIDLGIPLVGIYIPEIPANVFGSLKTKEIIIYSSSQIDYIDPDAFNSTYEHTRWFTASSYTLVSSEENHAVFNVLNRFRNLEELSIGYNEISYIPDDPFPEPMPNLKRVVINNNRLDYLGAGFFTNLPALQRAEFNALGLNLNKLTPATFEGIGPNVELYFQRNPVVSYLPREIFGQVLNTAKALYVGGEVCVIGCSHQRFACDERINWICENIELYQPKLDGYYCTEGMEVDHIWEYCGALNGTTSI